MQNRTFYVKPCWDKEARVFYTESDIEGLHVEAATLEEFRAVVMDAAAELIVANIGSAKRF